MEFIKIAKQRAASRETQTMRKSKEEKTSQNILRMREMLSQAAKYRRVAAKCLELRCTLATQMAMPGSTSITITFPPDSELYTLALGRNCGRKHYDYVQRRLRKTREDFEDRAGICEANAKRLHLEIAKALNLKTFEI